MLTVLEQGFITLVRSCLKNEKLTLPRGFETEKIYEAAKEHHVMNVVYSGAVLCGIDRNLPVMKKLFLGALKETVIDETQRQEFDKLKKLFKDNDISYMPLKGVLLKSIYSQPQMRFMNDIDVLIKLEEYEKICNLLITSGYEFQYESNHEYVWCKKGILSLELHKMLIPSYNEDFYHYFGNGWNKAIKKDNEYYLSKEDEFIYLFTHFAKHYRDGGIGVKHLIDLWLFKNSFKMGSEYIESELEKLRLLEFYKNVQDVLTVWFEEKPANGKTDLISAYVLENGAYGTYENGVASLVLRLKAGKRQSKKKVRNRLILTKIFPSYSVMKEQHKYLNKAAFLLPVAWVVRWMNAILNKGKNIPIHIAYIKSISTKKVSKFESQLKFVGLDFDFREQK